MARWRRTPPRLPPSFISRRVVSRGSRMGDLGVNVNSPSTKVAGSGQVSRGAEGRSPAVELAVDATDLAPVEEYGPAPEVPRPARPTGAGPRSAVIPHLVDPRRLGPGRRTAACEIAPLQRLAE